MYTYYEIRSDVRWKLTDHTFVLICSPFPGHSAKDIVNEPTKCLSTSEQFKKEGKVIVGYIRKSHGPETEEKREELLLKMVEALTTRCTPQHIYASIVSSADESIAERDVGSDGILHGTDGDTQSKSFIYEWENDIRSNGLPADSHATFIGWVYQKCGAGRDRLRWPHDRSTRSLALTTTRYASFTEIIDDDVWDTIFFLYLSVDFIEQRGDTI